MNEITSNETPQKRPGNRKKTITNQAWSSLKDSLSKAPLTTDQKIEQLIDNQANLTDQVHNVTLWLNQLIELSKIMIKNQIEGWGSLENKLQTIIKAQSGIEIFLLAEKNKAQAKEVMRQLNEFKLSADSNGDLKENLEIVIKEKNINALAPDWWTLLKNALQSDNITLVELLLSSPDIYVDDSIIQKARSPETEKMLKEYLDNKK